MANPLNKRFPRELKNNLGKYLGLFAMMMFASAFTSGFLMTANSIDVMLNTVAETYNLEDGRFTCDFEASEEAIDAVEALGTTITEDFYKQVPLELTQAGDAASYEGTITARIYANRTQVNLPAYAAGRAPEKAGEVAFDRVFMENHELALGDTIALSNENFEIVGMLTLPDYQALFENNSSFMFDAISFTVGCVAQEAFRSLGGTESFNYSFTFNDQNLDLAARTTLEEDMIDALADHDALLADFIDAEDNQGIGYAADDVESDSSMWTVLLMLLVVIMAFVFVVLTGATIEAESATIGTMLASGWRKGELIAHYMVLPTIIGALGVVAGLALGLSFLAEPFKDLYYNSYSLPPLTQIWSWRVVFVTSVVPFLLLVGITFIGLVRKMKFTPLQFLRHETSTRKRNAHLPLPEKMRYPSKFRLRVLLRNASHFITLFFGIMFASLLLLFGTCMLPVVKNYAIELRETITAPHQYVLKAPVELEGTPDEKEKYAAALRVIEDKDRYEANRNAIDAAERLEDNEELMDALERLMDNDELIDAFDRLQDNEELMDALDRLQDNRPLMDAIERLQDNDELLDAINRIKDNDALMDAIERLQDNQALLDAAQRLENNQALLDAVERLENNQALVDAAQRLQNQTELMYWVEWAQLNPDYVAAATRVAAGSTATSDLAYIAALSAEEQAGLQMLSNIDAQTQADMDLVQNADAQTQADLELLSNLDAQTQADLDLIQNADAQTQDDIDLLQNLDAQTRADVDLLTDLDDQTQADVDLLADLDEQTQADVDLLTDLDDQTQADVDLLTDLDDATQDDIDLIRNVDDATQDDIDLVRSMDESLLDDFRLAADIDEDTHVINTQDNSTSAINQAEKFAMGSLEILRRFGGQYESVTVYGIQPNSAYWTEIPVADGVIVAGRGTLEKTQATLGQAVEAVNRRAGETYELSIAEEGSNAADVSLYMTLADFNKLFDNDADYFNAYASADELAFDNRYLARSIVPEDMDKISKQMEDSMGNIMYLMLAMAIPIYFILVYLLTKTVIDRSSRSISYMKVFGYRSGEVSGLYVRPMTFWVLFCLIASIPLIMILLIALLTLAFTRFSGNFTIIIPPLRLAELVLIGMITYAVVAALHMRRIRKVPLELAMKVQE